MKINMYKIIAPILFILLVFTGVYAQHESHYDFEKIIDSYPNASEMRKVMHHFSKKKDSLKLRATFFLLKNMKGHKSYSYHWADTLDNRVDFDELNYDDFGSSVQAFNELKEACGKLKPVQDTLSDVKMITADFLINAVEEAFHFYNESMDFDLFCEYVLPYRISAEPLSEWRKAYRDRFSKVIAPNQSISIEDKIDYLKDDLTNWFVCTYGIEKRTDPLPLLSALQLLHRKKGPCEDVASLAAFSLRSIGVPATVDIVPYWATSTGGHTLNVTIDTSNSPVHFDVLSLSDSLHEFIREPAKVFRLTYSENPNSLAKRIPLEQIPPYGLLRQSNYIDVTHEYWPTRDVVFDLFRDIEDSTVIYACTFNGLDWKPVWWGYAMGGKAIATNMCQGAVFLPKIFKDGKLVAVGNPVASGYKETKILKPFSADYNAKPRKVTHTVALKEVEGYIRFKPGEKYALYFYYDKKWRLLDSRTAHKNTKELKFAFVPKNALLILTPKNKRGTERPFIINDAGERFWW